MDLHAFLATIVRRKWLVLGATRNGRGAAIAQSRDQLRQVGARVNGGVLNGGVGWRGPRAYGVPEHHRGLLSRKRVPKTQDAPVSPVAPELQRRSSA